MWKKSLGTIAAALPLLLAAATAHAADLRIFVGGAMTATVDEIGKDFARSSGNKVEIVSDTTGSLQNKLRAGEKADVLVITAAGIDQLQKENRVVAGTRTDLVRALIGVAMKPGGMAPDLSSPDAFKKSLLSVRSVSYVDPKAGGTSGTYFEGLMAKMGIASEMKAKTVYRNQGSEVADAVAKGDAEIGISFIAELAPNKGVRIAGPLPDAIQMPTDYVAALPTGSPNGDAARAFIQALKSPKGADVFTKAGLTVLAAH